MNFYNQYMDFYTGENRKAIFLNFCGFIESLRDNNLVNLKTYLFEDCIADISMTGHFQGADAVCQGLRWPGPQMDIMRITISSFIARSHGNLGQQCAYTQHLAAQEDEEQVYPFTFGGQFCNSYKKVNGVWKIAHIRFDLMFESGNNVYVKDAWQLMDYSILFGHLPMINPELESPWLVIPDDEEPQSDAEQIFELEFRNNIGMDGGAFNLSHVIFSDEIILNYSAHKNINKNLSGAADGDYYGRKDAINFFKSKQHKEARLQHIVSMAELNIQGTRARAYMIRSEYNRIKHHIYNKQTVHCQPLSAVHEIDAIKEDGIWKMKRMTYYPIMEFFPMEDDCICYDEMLCGDSFWMEIKKKLAIDVLSPSQLDMM